MIRPNEIWVMVEPVDMRGGIDGLSLRVWLAVEPVDMRGGIDTLSQRIQNLLGTSPCDGTAYAFRNRRSTRLKLLIWARMATR